MIIPSIDIQGGQAVQLINGEKLAVEAGDPSPLAERFGRTGPIAVIDLDAAMGTGSNREQIKTLCQQTRCRVGGGIRDAQTALDWLNNGAEQIIIGTAASRELLAQLPRERVLVALDAKYDEVVVNGWTKGTGRTVESRMEELRDVVAGFLVTFVENEGLMQGTRLDRVAALQNAAGGCSLTIAGGVTTAEDIRRLDALGVDAQVGMALYTGRMSLAEGFAAPLTSDRPDGLWPTVVVDEYERALGLCYSNLQSLTEALESGRGVYWSRSRGLWKKGESSGATQQLLAVDIDCDRDTLRFKVRQNGPGFCHLKTLSCFGNLGGLPALSERLERRKEKAPQGSYTKRLFADPELLSAKLREEAQELTEAQAAEDVVWEAADVFYFTLATLAQRGVPLTEVLHQLDQRALQVTRRPGNAKTKETLQ